MNPSNPKAQGHTPEQITLVELVRRWKCHGELLEALQAILLVGDDLFKLSQDCIVHDGDNWHCKSCGMELDSGSGHSDSCCASRILDLAVPLHNAEKVIANATT